MDGLLTETDLANFIRDSMQKSTGLARMDKKFTKFYIITACRKFFFFLDESKRGKISIDDILASPILVEFNDLQNDDLSQDEEMNNWFSSPSARSVYDAFVKLDFARDGLLSRNEFSAFNNNNLTSAFTDRFFQVYSTHSKSKIDYKTFVDFLLAWENKNTRPSMAFFYRVLDVHELGYLTPFVLNIFFREVLKKLQQQNACDAQLRTVDMIEDVYAMVKPKHEKDITLNDLFNSNCGGTIISMLIDAKAFWEYENRESLNQQPGPR
jgi:serine/threonine-protein phosphatase 2A regulatory subunit B''